MTTLTVLTSSGNKIDLPPLPQLSQNGSYLLFLLRSVIVVFICGINELNCPIFVLKYLFF
jgi:hypothetical protein